MIKTMIVEDEFLARQDLRALIDWEKYGFHIIAEAANGMEGLELFRKFQPDLVITDVRMPVMDGLQMAEEIIKSGKDTKFILLTAYDEFEYARNALKLGIKSYILKHETDSGVFLDELLKIKEIVLEDAGNKQFTTKYILKKITKEPLSSIELQALIERYRIPVRRNKTVMLVAAKDCHLESSTSMYCDMEDESGKIIEIIRTALNGNTNGDVFSLEENRYLIFVNQPDNNSKARMMEYIRKVCLDIQTQVKKSMKTTISIAIGGIIEEYHQIQTYYRKLVNLINLKFFTRGAAILEYVEAAISKDSVYAELNSLTQQFKENMLTDKLYEAKKQLYSLFIDMLVKQRDMELYQEGLTVVILNALHMCFMKTESGQLQKFRNVKVLYEEASKFNTIFEVYEWIAGLIDLIEQTRHQGYSRRILQALRFIEKNYSRDIELEDIAGVMGVSDIYASQLFKSEVGESFKSYLIAYRMKKAEELLELGKYKIYEISEMVGYQTVQYFCQTFKKLTGKNPGDYTG